MWLPKAENGKYGYGNTKDGKVITYDETRHLKKLEVKNVENFGEDDDFSVVPNSSNDFSLD